MKPNWKMVIFMVLLAITIVVAGVLLATGEGAREGREYHVDIQQDILLQDNVEWEQ